jgi:hypothetical protein
MLLGAAFWILTPIFALAVLWQYANSASLTVPTSTWVVVEAPPERLSRTADLALAWGEEPALLAPAWGGIVQEVSVLPGDELRNGGTVCVVNAIARRAWSMTVPLYRPIGRGDRGQDVTALNGLLAALGLPHDQGDYAGWRTIQGIKQYAESIGAGRMPTFDPAWVIFLPVESEVNKVNLVVGALAPAPGSPIVTMAPRLLGAIVTEQSPLSGLTGVGDAGNEVGTSTNTATATIVPASLAPTETVSISGTQLDVATETGQIAEPSLTAVEQAVQPGQKRTQVTVYTPVPPQTVAIPYGAVATFGDRSCVVRRRVSQVETVQITPQVPGPGRAYVTGSLQVGDEVLVPPAEMSGCP